MALTKDDKKFIEGIFDKKLNEKLDLKLGVQECKFENKFDEMEQKFEAKITEFKDEFYTKIDPILKEVVASREDRATAAEQHRRNEGRIEKLEEIHPQNKHLATI